MVLVLTFIIFGLRGRSSRCPITCFSLISLSKAHTLPVLMVIPMVSFPCFGHTTRLPVTSTKEATNDPALLLSTLSLGMMTSLTLSTLGRTMVKKRPVLEIFSMRFGFLISCKISCLSCLSTRCLLFMWG